MERETQLREGEAGGDGNKEKRRDGMMEVLRRLRKSDNDNRAGRGGGGGGKDCLSQRSSRQNEGALPVGNIDDHGCSDGEVLMVQERLEALALALSPGSKARAATSDLHGSEKASSSAAQGAGRGGVIQRGQESEQGAGRGGIKHRQTEEEEVMALLTEDEKIIFLREVASGRLGKLIVPWTPWWKQSGGVHEVVDEIVPEAMLKSHPLSLPSAVASRPRSDSSSANSQGSVKSEEGESCPSTQPPTPEQPQDLPSLSVAPDSAGDSSSFAMATAGGVSVSGQASGLVLGDEEECTRHSFSELLSQALQAPNFSTLSARPPSPALPALAVDLAYTYVLTARLYNGCWCSDPVGASLAFVGASPVLKDGATPRTAEQALDNCVKRAVETEGVGFREYAESLRQVRYLITGLLLVCMDTQREILAVDVWYIHSQGLHHSRICELGSACVRVIFSCCCELQYYRPTVLYLLTTVWNLNEAINICSSNIM